MAANGRRGGAGLGSMDLIALLILLFLILWMALRQFPSYVSRTQAPERATTDPTPPPVP